MKRSLPLIVFLVAGVFAAGRAVAGEETPPSKNWLSSSATLMLLGRGDVDSSKFEEYRTVPKGFSMPRFSLAGRLGGFDFALAGENISRRDQRYTGTIEGEWVRVTFDYNEIMHNIGFAGRTLFNDTAPGVCDRPRERGGHGRLPDAALPRDDDETLRGERQPGRHARR